MAIYRLDALVVDSIDKQQYPSNISCAIVWNELACIDQRVLWQLSPHLLRNADGSRPPGSLIIGNAINVLKQDYLPGEGVIKGLLINERQPLMKSKLHDPKGVY
ncbi:hypothetical protein BC941DRAFT_225544 [Chlamydoabsidia padenii]|nr:hypothetical protein BC941DRAFT_225544 [Chlamydoabsidia padenii]